MKTRVEMAATTVGKAKNFVRPNGIINQSSGVLI